jgi:CHAT domain-containing protein
MLRARFSSEDQKLLDQLNDTSARLANLVLDGPARLSDADQQEITSLQDRQEELEAEISRRSAGSYQKFQPLTIAAIRSVIPRGAALIEFAVYYPFDAKETAANAYGPPHYIAYIVRQQGEVEWKELGVAQTIDAAIKAWRGALRDPQARDVRQLARAVDKRVMEPLRGLLGNTTQLLISPDGGLNLIPFAALVDERNQYLIQRHSFTYLTSGRDLLRMQIARTPKTKPVVIADPLFGDNQVGSVKQTISGRQTLNRSVTNTRELSDVYFAQLPGTEIEASIIKAVFQEASVLTGQSATETALKAITAPRLLHIATHGFFLEDSSITAVNRQTATGNNSSPLAGANKRSADGDDGILTALEASGLNLWGTKLVVLSACDTGVGQVRNGEGVYGLRRAFVLAGAESLVMSLWPASDYTTRRLMTDYYKNLKQGMGRGDSLRQVQLNMLKRDPHLHPFYWANFIQAGDWSSLDGRR